MADKDVVLWEARSPARIPKSAKAVPAVLDHAKQMVEKDKQQVISGFKHGNYEMASNYVWSKTRLSLKRQLSKLGVTFIAEMLNRTDIDENSSIEDVITDYEAIRLAEELGMLSGTGAFRLRNAMDIVGHFGALEGEEADAEDMTQQEAETVLRSCVENVLAYEKIDVALDFANFRKELESITFKNDDRGIRRLEDSPYFFQRTAIRVLLALIKTSSGAQLEHATANFNVICPLLWNRLQHPERWQIGRTYAEVIADGKKVASAGLRAALLKVQGFDFVPEDLRSNSFIQMAGEALRAHEGFNNFYSEPAPMKSLASMGSVIPSPALSLCVSAVLCIKLGKSWGHCWGAQASADTILDRLSEDRWAYFINGCLASDERVLYKLISETTAKRWIQIVEKYNLGDLVIQDRAMERLIVASKKKNVCDVGQFAQALLHKLGYKSA